MDFKEKLIQSITDIDQRIFIKFLVILGWSGNLIADTLVKALGKRALARRTVQNWCSRFNSGDTDVGERRGGSRADSEIHHERLLKVKEAMDQTRHWSLRTLSNKLSIPLKTVHRIVKDELKLTKKLGKWVPHELSEAEKEHRVLASKDNLERFSKDKSLIRRTLTIDETWVSLYMAPDRAQAKVWLGPDEPGPSHVRQEIHGNKRMLIMAMDHDGIAFWRLLPEKTTVTAEIYRNFLNEEIPKWLRGKSFRRPILLHDNARPHKARLVTDFLKEKQIPTWSHPLFSRYQPARL